MATERQKEAARRNLKRARQAPCGQGRDPDVPSSSGLSTAEKDRLTESQFAFPKERKEPLIDASHVRNVIARFDQVEGVSDRERDEAWERIATAARKFGIAVEANNWRELFVRKQQGH